MLVQLGLGQRANRGERFHLRMIGALTRPGRSARLRSVALGAVAICGIGLLFGLRPADPMLADPALAAAYRRQLETTARDADTALRQLGDGLQLALGWARQGAANTLSGEAAPGPQLAIAGGRVEALDGRLGAARAELAAESEFDHTVVNTDVQSAAAGLVQLMAESRPGSPVR